MKEHNNSNLKSIIYDSQKREDPLREYINHLDKIDCMPYADLENKLQMKYIFSNNYIGVAKSNRDNLHKLIEIINKEIVEWEKVVSLCESHIKDLKQYHEDSDETNCDEDEDYYKDDFDSGSNYDRDGNPNYWM
jgi:hypothetical protein